MFIASILLLAIIAMGAVSASEEISDDVAAIEPTEELDEAIAESVDDEPVLETESTPAEEIDDGALGYSEVTEDWNVSIYNVTEVRNNLNFIDAVRIKSNNEKNGELRIYVNSTRTYVLNYRNGGAYGVTKDAHISPNQMGIYDFGTYGITVNFAEEGDPDGEKTLTHQVMTISKPDDAPEFSAYVYNMSYDEDDWDNDDFISFYSNSIRSGLLTIYANEFKKSYVIEKGKIMNSDDDGTFYKYIAPSDLGIRKYGLYSVKITFKDNDSGNEITITEKNSSIMFSILANNFEVMWMNLIGADESFPLIIRFPAEAIGNVSVFNSTKEDLGEFTRIAHDQLIGSANIVNGIATVLISGLSIHDENDLFITYTTNMGNGTFTRTFKALRNSEGISASLSQTEIEVGKNVVLTFNSDKISDLLFYVDGELTNITDVSSYTHTISGLTAGTHIIRVFYSYNMTFIGMDPIQINGDFYLNSFKVTVKAKPTPSTPNSTSPTVKPVVKKVATKIVAAKKTFKVKTKVKKYTISLKTKAGKAIKKVRVTLKVKGKTYKATTNKKGKATFKIKNLKNKGKYTAVIKFAGNKNYKASSKKVKLTVKK